MCLLVVLSRVIPGAPLVVAANRDELLARPARPMGVLSHADPRILGGRDEVGGGTWLAVNEHGVVAALTNRPALPDRSKRSRGELPLTLAAHASAAEAAHALAAAVDPAAYNPCWVLVGDRRSLHYLELGDGALGPVDLSPGLHVLENRPLGAPSPKADHVRAAVERRLGAERLPEALVEVLADHTVPPSPGADPGPVRAACVHAGPYGTRTATLVRVPAPPAARPAVWASDGPPCTAPMLDASALW